MRSKKLWRVTTQIWEVLRIGLGSFTLSMRTFCSRFSDVREPLVALRNVGCLLWPSILLLYRIQLTFTFFFTIRNKWQSADKWPKRYESLMEDFFTGFQGKDVIEVTGVFKILGYESIILQSNFNIISIDPILCIADWEWWIIRFTQSSQLGQVGVVCGRWISTQSACVQFFTVVFSGACLPSVEIREL